MTLDFLRQYVAPKTSPMCGNTICQDRRFLHREMPALEQYFHYRNLDVTSLKILAQLWQPEMASDFCKTSQHLALQDIRDSIDLADQTFVGVVQARPESSGAVEANGGDAGGQLLMFTVDLD